MHRQDKDIEDLFDDVRNASAKVILALNALTRGRTRHGEIDKNLLEDAINRQQEWRRAVDFYIARKKQDINASENNA